MTRPRHILFLAAVVTLSSPIACGDEYPPARSGGTISGTVSYSGHAIADLENPAVLVAAFTVDPESDFPHALTILADPDFASGPIPYELRNLPAWDTYYVLAQLGEEGDLSSPPLSVGAYPDFCTVLESTSGSVRVTDDISAENIDLTIYDGGGAQDPCFSVGGDICPQAGMSTLAIEIQTTYSNDDVRPEDMLVVALFKTWPSSDLPDYIGLITTGIEFPYRFVGNDVEPGSYAITVCFDIGGDDLLNGGCGDEDMDAAHEQGAMVTFAADHIVETTLSIDDESSGPVTSTPAGDLGCD